MMRRAAQKLAAAAILAAGSALGGEGMHSIVDPAGRTVSVPAEPDRVACLTGACYEKVFLLGQADKVLVRQRTFPPWMVRTNPRAAAIATMAEPNAEDLLERGVQVAFSFNRPAMLAVLRSAGIAAVVPDAPAGLVNNREQFIARVKDEITFYGRVLGGDAPARAEAWRGYFDRKLAAVTARTDAIPAARRPKVYYVRGPTATTTHGHDSNMRWYGELAGADMGLARTAKAGIAQVTMEEIAAWNPDIIFVGRQYDSALVTADPRWQDITAVKQGRVHPIPDGVFFWDASSEGILLLEYMAKTIWPTLFSDLDIDKEVKDYYETFYHTVLSDYEARLLVEGHGPNGTRSNPANN